MIIKLSFIHGIGSLFSILASVVAIQIGLPFASCDNILEDANGTSKPCNYSILPVIMISSVG